DASRRRDSSGVDGRSARPQEASDDFNRLVFGLQLHRGLFTYLLVFAAVSHSAWHRHGCRMASRRRTSNGTMAATNAPFYEWRAARVVGAWLPSVECMLLAALRQLGLAWHAMDRHPPGVGDRLHPLLRQGAGGVGREPTPPKGGEPQRQGTARGDLPPRY